MREARTLSPLERRAYAYAAEIVMGAKVDWGTGQITGGIRL